LTYKVILTKGAQKDYHHLEVKIQEQISDSLKQLKAFLSGDLEKMPDIKRLKGKYNGLYRLRCGQYRIIYDAKNKIRVIHIIKIMHRQSVYLFSQLFRGFLTYLIFFIAGRICPEMNKVSF
jgi:mRNA interferase RelE/StbE